MFNQTHKISESNTAVLTITFSNTKDTIIHVIIGLVRDVARTFKEGGGGSPADTDNYDRFDAPIALNTREV